MQASVSGDHTTVLSVDGVSKSFDGKRALENVSLRASAGELIGLVGANGGGKTTLLRHLTGMLSADVGRVTLLSGEPPFDEDVRRQIGYVPQVLSLYGGMTVRENLTFYADVYQVDDPATTITDTAARFELDQFLDKRVCDLSGGWARVAQLAASLVYMPQILLLDEPTAGLDASMRARFWSFLRHYSNEGNTVVISTHDLDEAQQCDKIMFLSGGKTLFLDTPQAIIQEVNSAILHIENNNILEEVNTAVKDMANCLLQEYLGGVKILAAAQNAVELEQSLKGAGVSFQRLRPTLSDVCSLKLAEVNS